MNEKVIYLKDLKGGKIMEEKNKKNEHLSIIRLIFLAIFSFICHTILGLLTIIGFFSSIMLLVGKSNNNESYFMNHFNYLVNEQGLFSSVLLLTIFCFFAYEFGRIIRGKKFI